MAARAPISAVFGLALGALQLGIGGLLLGWAWVTFVKPAQGFVAVRWLVGNTPLPWSGTPDEIGNIAVQDGVIFGVGVAGAVLTAFALGTLWKARRNLLPANASASGKFRLDLVAPPRLGCWLEGEIALLKGGNAGDPYEVWVRCARRVVDHRPDPDSSDGREAYHRDEVKYEQRVQSKAVSRAAGPAVPFRFEIPTHVPVEGSGAAVPWMQFHWTIAVCKPMSLFRTTFPLDVQRLAPGEAGKAIGNTSSAPRNWVHVEPTPAEARMQDLGERAFDRAGKVVLWICAAGALAFGGICLVITMKAVKAWFP